MSENALIVQNYAVVSMEQKVLAEVLQENLGGEGLTSYDLDRVKIPTGGSTTWEVQTLEGLQETKEITGIIIYWKQPRAYWSKSMEETGGGSAPDCYSEDGNVGIGEPGGDCFSCPFAQYGTAQNGQGRGQACKQTRLLFMVDPERTLPFVVAASPASIQPLKKYFLRLTSSNIPYYAVVTKITLEKAKNQGGITYARVVPQMAQRLDPEQVVRIKAYADAIRPHLDRVTIEQMDVEGTVE